MKYKIKPLTKKQRKSLQMLYAAVDPDVLKKISELLKRELIAEKDTEDYNTSLISSYFDKPSLLLRESGQSKIKAGDVFKLHEVIQSKEQEREELNGFYDNQVAVSNYEYFPFSWKLGQEIRSRFILKTEKDDTFDKLMDEIDGYISKFLSIDDWILLKNSIKKSELRFENNVVNFLQPEKFLGVPVKLSNLDSKKQEINNPEFNFIIDQRKDSHDLLSLKEFLSIIKGDDVHPLTIGPGFFAKYMPEISANGIDSIVFKVYQNKLTEIKIVKKDDENPRLNFSPIKAAQSVIDLYCIEEKKGFFSTTKKYADDSILDEDLSFYVVTDGCVSGPKEGFPLGYKSMSKNELKIPAGEVFLIDTVGNEIQNTRIYFVPYSYQDLHLCHQHGSVIFGNNDQSFNSCVLDEKQFFDENSILNLINKIKSNKKMLYEPAFMSVLVHYLPKGSTPDLILLEENQELLYKAMSSVFEETSFTINYLVEEYFSGNENFEKLLLKFLRNYAPINKRFLLGKYFEDENGLLLEKNDTTYILFGKKLYMEHQINLMNKRLKK